MKNILPPQLIYFISIMFLFLLNMNNVHSQDSFIKEQNHVASGVINTSVIRYENNASILLEFNNIDLERNIKLQDSRGKVISKLYSLGNQFLLSNLNYDITYELIHSDPYSGEEYIYAFDIQKQFDKTHKLSPIMFDVISEFSQQSEFSLDVYLEHIFGKNHIESISVLQNFIDRKFYRADKNRKNIVLQERKYFDISPRIEFIKNDIPIFWDTNCNCSVVMSQHASPIGNPPIRYNYYLNHTEIDIDRINFNNNSDGWSYRYEKGPAKAHLNWTRGKSAGGTYRSYGFSNSTGLNPPIYTSSLSYIFLCMNRDGRPGDCPCTVDVDVQSTYDTYINVEAEIKPGIGSIGNKEADALAEDCAILIEHPGRGQQPNMLACGMTSIMRDCNSELNPSWFLDLAQVAGIIAIVIFAPNTAPTLISAFVDSLTGLVSSNATTFSGECGVDQRELSLINNTSTRTLTANNPISFELFGFTNQRTGGKRAWYAQSDIVSNFSLAGVVVGTQSTSNNECCIDSGANWVFSSAVGAPKTSQDLNSDVGVFLYNHWSSFPLSSNFVTGGYTLPIELGITSDVLCTRSGSGGLGGITNHNIESNKLLSATRDVIEFKAFHDMSGRLIMDLSNFNFRGYSKEEVISELRNVNYNISSGIYIITYMNDGILEAEKVSFISGSN